MWFLIVSLFTSEQNFSYWGDNLNIIFIVILRGFLENHSSSFLFYFSSSSKSSHFFFLLNFVFKVLFFLKNQSHSCFCSKHLILLSFTLSTHFIWREKVSSSIDGDVFFFWILTYICSISKFHQLDTGESVPKSFSSHFLDRKRLSFHVHFDVLFPKIVQQNENLCTHCFDFSERCRFERVGGSKEPKISFMPKSFLFFASFTRKVSSRKLLKESHVQTFYDVFISLHNKFEESGVSCCVKKKTEK